jgi:hypothetical protein
VYNIFRGEVGGQLISSLHTIAQSRCDNGVCQLQFQETEEQSLRGFTATTILLLLLLLLLYILQ